MFKRNNKNAKRRDATSFLPSRFLHCSSVVCKNFDFILILALTNRMGLLQTFGRLRGRSDLEKRFSTNDYRDNAVFSLKFFVFLG